MTLNGHFALCFKIHAFLKPTMKIWMKIDPYCQQQGCSTMTVVSGNIRFIRVFAGVPWSLRWGDKRLRGNQKRGFSGLRLRHLWKWGQHYYIVSAPCRLSTDPKIRDLELPFSLIFTVTNCEFTNSFYIYRRAYLYLVTSREVPKRTVIHRIVEIRGRTADLS